MNKFRKTSKPLAEPVEGEPVPNWATLALQDNFLISTTERQLQSIPRELSSSAPTGHRSLALQGSLLSGSSSATRGGS